MKQEALIPKVGVVTDIRQDTPDVKTFRVVGLDGNKLFEHMPGQCAMVSIPGIGEGMFSITSSPTNKEFMEFSIKKCGCLTSWLHMMDVGQEVTVRGPLGKNFPVETVPTPENGNYGLKGKDLLFIAGGIGLAPLRSVINYCRDKKRENPDAYGSLHIIYGSRSKDDLVDYQEILDEWSKDCKGGLGRSRWLYSELCQGTEAGPEPYCFDLRTSDHDQVHTGRSERTGLPRRTGLYHNGTAYEMRYRQVRTLQYR